MKKTEMFALSTDFVDGDSHERCGDDHHGFDDVIVMSSVQLVERDDAIEQSHDNRDYQDSLQSPIVNHELRHHMDDMDYQDTLISPKRPEPREQIEETTNNPSTDTSIASEEDDFKFGTLQTRFQVMSPQESKMPRSESNHHNAISPPLTDDHEDLTDMTVETDAAEGDDFRFDALKRRFQPPAKSAPQTKSTPQPKQTFGVVLRSTGRSVEKLRGVVGDDRTPPRSRTGNSPIRDLSNARAREDRGRSAFAALLSDPHRRDGATSETTQPITVSSPLGNSSLGSCASDKENNTFRYAPQSMFGVKLRSSKTRSVTEREEESREAGEGDSNSTTEAPREGIASNGQPDFLKRGSPAPKEDRGRRNDPSARHHQHQTGSYGRHDNAVRKRPSDVAARKFSRQRSGGDDSNEDCTDDDCSRVTDNSASNTIVSCSVGSPRSDKWKQNPGHHRIKSNDFIRRRLQIFENSSNEGNRDSDDSSQVTNLTAPTGMGGEWRRNRQRASGLDFERKTTEESDRRTAMTDTVAGGEDFTRKYPQLKPRHSPFGVVLRPTSKH